MTTMRPELEVSRSSRNGFDELARDLQQLRLEAGAPSYTELTTRITQNREARGMTPAAARVARSSIYDAFRLGRKRVNPELITEIVRALGCNEDEVTAWSLRSVAARDDSVGPDGYRPGGAPLALFAVVLGVAMVGLNHVLNFSVNAIHVPLYLDMVGTAFAAIAFGPWAGVAVGVSTNLLGNLMNGDFSGSWFSLVQITGAVMWGYGFRRWFGRGPWRFLLLNLLTAVACSVVAVPIILFAFDGASTLNGAATLASATQELGTGLLAAVFSVNLLTSLADKILSGYFALVILWMLSRHGYVLTENIQARLRLVRPRITARVTSL